MILSGVRLNKGLTKYWFASRIRGGVTMMELGCTAIKTRPVGKIHPERLIW